MSLYIADMLRRQVAIRANFRCEYCRRLETGSFIRFQADHCISRKHGGKTTFINLAHCCPLCNNAKGSDLSTVLGDQYQIIRLFNPRRDDWFEHFDVQEGLIVGITDIGEGTVKLLKMNEIDRVLERLDLIEAGLFP
jgi:HNH endonuclease